ncbi:MAG: multidrug efflux RND transporter permease subunit [Verrucomicrobiae bacterium]|nr:multidrug efflux RND transporter permease subunit [Verrucomicrobiae bacterium]
MGPRFFIDRPIFASVVSIVIVLLGLLAVKGLPVEQYPNIVPPSVQMSAVYPGASAEVVAQGVAAPIETQISGIPGLIYFSSVNSSDGSMNLTAFFDIGTDQNIAAVDLQNRLSIAQPQLPMSVVQQGITITKQSTSILSVIALTSDDPRYDATFLSNYAIREVLDTIKRVPGVGNATVYGNYNYTMRLILDPIKMAQFKLTPADIAAVIHEQNADYPGGRIGRPPAPRDTEMTFNVITQGRFSDVSEFENVIIRSDSQGSRVLLGDVARIEMGSQSYDYQGRLNGNPTALILVYLSPGANSLRTQENIKRVMEDFSKSLPAGIRYSIPFDTTKFVEISIHEVAHTLLEAMVLVFIVLFVFLQNWRATLIPCIAVPVALIGTFAGLAALGFTINLLTLFAMVLAIGIVVDDAIVVVENVERIMAEEGLSPREASKKAMDEVAGALVAIVLVLCSVFLPVAFMGGLVGQLYKQFAITIAVSVVISGIVALTLTPALCALLLRPVHGGRDRGVAGIFNRFFEKITHGYTSGVHLLLKRSAAGVLVFLVLLGALVVLSKRVPAGFIPEEDQGYFLTVLQLPGGASSERTMAVVEKVEAQLRSLPEVSDIITLTGMNFAFNSSGNNCASCFVQLKNWDQRKKPDQSVWGVLERAREKFALLPEATILCFNSPPISGLGSVGGFSMEIENRSALDYKTFVAQAREFAEKAGKLPEIAFARTSVTTSVPQLYIEVNRPQAKALGLNIADIFGTLQAYFGSQYINDFFKFGRVYRVQTEGESTFRDKPDDINNIFVRSNKGEMIPVNTVASYRIVPGPDTVFNFNGYNSALLSGSAREGVSSGQALDALARLAETELFPRGLGYDWSNTSYQERKASGTATLILGFGMLMVFLILAAQYESWTIPFAVILAVPLGVFGAFLAIFLRGIENDIYFGIGMLTLVGLAAKNAILIVEVCNQLHRSGQPLLDSALQACRMRFRPILMTSFAFILGIVPLMISTGAGAASRHSIGTGVFGGMLAATLLAIFLVPLFFVLIVRFTTRGCPPGESAPTKTPAP